jgi:hypothetical protein
MANERQVPHVAVPADLRGAWARARTDRKGPGQAFGVAVEPVVERGEAVEVVDGLAQSVDVHGRCPVVSGASGSVDSPSCRGRRCRRDDPATEKMPRTLRFS